MTETEFCNKAMGAPWVSRGESFDGVDCWGLVVHSFKEVDGIILPQVNGYADGDIEIQDGGDLALSTGRYTPSQPCNGAIMAIYDTHGKMFHVGRCLCGRVLHATRQLGVRLDTYRAINKKYTDVRYFMYKGE